MARPLSWALFLLATIAAPAHAADRPIVGIEARSMVVREGRDLERDLRAMVTREVEALRFGKAPRAKYTLTASLTTLETATDGGKARSSARVSVVLSEARGGALRAVLDGRATAEDAASATARAEQTALEAAVQGAVRSLPDAVK